MNNSTKKPGRPTGTAGIRKAKLKAEIKARYNFTLSDQIKDYLEQMSKSGISMSELVQIAVFNLYQDKKDWIFCPECKCFACYKPRIPAEGQISINCNNCKCKFLENIYGRQPV